MSLLVPLVLILEGVLGTAIVFAFDPVDQSILTSFNAIFLVIVFLVLQAPDVCLSLISINAFVVPFALFVTLAQVIKEKKP